MVTQDPNLSSASISLNTAFGEKRNRSDSSITSSISMESELKKLHLDNSTVNNVVDEITLPWLAKNVLELLCQDQADFTRYSNDQLFGKQRPSQGHHPAGPSCTSPQPQQTGKRIRQKTPERPPMQGPLTYLIFKFEIVSFILHYGICIRTCHLSINLLTFLKYI